MGETISQVFSLEAIRSGDRAEFARLVDAYSKSIYRLALRMLGDSQDAEDVLQNTFLRALKSLPTFEGRSNILTWLYRIAVNEALMHIRHQQPDLQVGIDGDDTNDNDFIPSQFVDWCCLSEAELLSSESQTYLDRVIQQLPEKLRVVFILRDIEGLSIRETCEALSLTETIVKTRLFRARMHLRNQLSTYYGERLGKEAI